MNDESASAKSGRRWRVWELVLSIGLGAGVVGFAVAVGAPFAVDWIKKGIEDDAEAFLSGVARFAVVVAVGLASAVGLVLLALTIFRGSWRARTWSKLGKWRPFTTTDRIALERAGAVEDYLSGSDQDSVATMKKRPRTDPMRAKAPRGQINLPRAASPMNPGGTFARYAKPSTPIPPPRWGVFRDSVDGQFILTNTVDRSVATVVRLDEVVLGTFYFRSGAQWDDMSGESAEVFQGRPDIDALHNGIQFKVSWVDENQEPQEDIVELPRESRVY